jgi:hypothetical protein
MLIKLETNSLRTVDSTYAIYITSVIFPCYGGPRNTHRCTQQHHSLEKNYLLTRKYWHVLYIPALSNLDLCVRFYGFLPVILRITKTTNSVFNSFSKDPFLVKGKPFLCMLLLLVYVSPFISAHIHFRRCGFVHKATETLYKEACGSVGR